MLPAKHRLKSRREFNDIFRNGKTFFDELLLLKAVGGGKEKLSRFGFGASLKFSKKSTERNKAKRLMREAVRARIKAITTGWIAIFLVKPDCPKKKLDLESIQKSVDYLLKKAKILKI